MQVLGAERHRLAKREGEWKADIPSAASFLVLSRE